MDTKVVYLPPLILHGGEYTPVLNLHASDIRYISIILDYTNIKQDVCHSVCLFVPKDLANRWSDRVASNRSREGL